LAHFTGSRKLAKILIRAKSRLASEWIPGETNKVANSFSRNTDLSDADLMTILRLHVPLQLPPKFKMKVLPAEISTWVTSLLHLPDPKQSPAWFRWESYLRQIDIDDIFLGRRPVGRPRRFLFRPSRWATSAWQTQRNG
jgi:hypothetical protein